MKEPKTRKVAKTQIAKLVEQAEESVRKGNHGKVWDLRREILYIAYGWNLQGDVPTWIRKA